jgi:hypothetical protein
MLLNFLLLSKSFLLLAVGWRLVLGYTFFSESDIEYSTAYSA